jgi:broad specificity phosphatase PhoE
MSGAEQEVVVIRHGETEWSRTGRHTGRTDIPLTDDGRRQAKLLGRKLEGRTFALVLTSPLSRAAETCELTGLGDQAEVTDDLLEWDYGDYEGRHSDDIRKERPGWTLWTGGVTNGERIEDVAARVERVIDRAHTARGDVALFAHGHVLRVLAARWADLPPTAGAALFLSTATYSVLGWERDAPVITRWNEPA